MIIRTDKESDEVRKAAYERSAAFWDIAVSDGAESAEVTQAMLIARFATPPTDAEFHFAPTSFTLDGDFTFIPMRWDAAWPALEKTIQQMRPKAILSFLPSALSIGPMIIETFRRTKALGMTASVENMPLALEIIRQLGVELLICTPQNAFAFFTKAPLEAVLSLRAVHLVIEPKDAAIMIPYPGTVLKDIHVMPGVSVAYQCVHVKEYGKDRFHLSPQFAWHVDDGHIRVTSIDDRPAPLFRYLIGHGSIEERRCSCGEEFSLTLL